MSKSPRLFGDYLQRPSEVWQLALERAPLPVLDDEEQPFLPQVAICLNVERDLIEMSAPTLPGAVEGVGNAREALKRGAREWRVKPALVLTENAALVAALRDELAAEEVTIESRPELPEIRGVLATLHATLAEPDLVPDLLFGEGIKLEQVLAFTRASQAFWENAPWRWLSDEDLVRVEGPDLGDELRYFCLMGAAGEQYGLLFFDSPETWEAAFDNNPEERLERHGYWAVSIDEPAEALSTDVALWLREELPRVGGSRIPVALYFKKDDPRRPDARILAFFEGILSAFSSLTEEEVDRGRFERAVITHRGPAQFAFSLPGLLEEDDLPGEGDAPADGEGEESGDPTWSSEEGGVSRRLRQLMDRREFASVEDAEAELERAVAAGEIEAYDLNPTQRRAHEMLELAFESRGRRQIQLARRALAIDPDLIDAYNFLAAQAVDPAEAAALYRQAHAIAERTLDPALFEKEEGNFFLLDEARPYLRSRTGLAATLRELDEPDEAAELYEETLRLDDGDHFGSRYQLADLYLENDRLDALGELLDRFRDDKFANWSFTRALHAFRVHGDAPAALRALRTACQSNPHVPVFLLGEKEIPDELPDLYAPGGEEEAAHYAAEAFEAWDETENALDWMAAFAPPPPKPETGKRRGGKGRDGGKRKGGSQRKR